MVGPLRDSDNRPFVKTRLKYNVTVSMAQGTWENPPEAIDVITEKRIRTPLDDVVENVQDQIGDVILAVQNFSHPNRTKVIDTEVEYPEPNNFVDDGTVHVTWTYVVDGSGIGEAAETRILLSQAKDLYTVLIEGSNEPIKNNTAIRNFAPGILIVRDVSISTN